MWYEKYLFLQENCSIFFSFYRFWAKTQCGLYLSLGVVILRNYAKKWTFLLAAVIQVVRQTFIHLYPNLKGYLLTLFALKTLIFLQNLSYWNLIYPRGNRQKVWPDADVQWSAKTTVVYCKLQLGIYINLLGRTDLQTKLVIKLFKKL